MLEASEEAVKVLEGRSRAPEPHPDHVRHVSDLWGGHRRQGTKARDRSKGGKGLLRRSGAERGAALVVPGRSDRCLKPLPFPSPR